MEKPAKVYKVQIGNMNCQYPWLTIQASSAKEAAKKAFECAREKGWNLAYKNAYVCDLHHQTLLVVNSGIGD